MFEKLIKKDYNEALEEILAQNEIEESARNLLQQILYKIEISYNDYKKAKRINKTEKQYMQEITETLKRRKVQIQVVNLSDNDVDEKIKDKLDENGFYIIDNKIITYPIERKLLYAVQKKSNNQLIVNSRYEIICKSISNVLNKGKSLDRVEVLRDFNGWSWTTLKKEIEDIDSNLIYQSLKIILGEEFIDGWCSDIDGIIDYIQLLKEELSNKFGEEISNQLFELLQKISIRIEYEKNKEFNKYINELDKIIENELENYKEIKSFTETKTKEKKQLRKKIGEIEKIINSKENLSKEYDKRNENLDIEHKIFSIKVLKQLLLEEKNDVLEEIEKINQAMIPQNFVKQKQEYEKKKKLIDSIKLNKNEIVLEFQKIILQCLYIMANNVEENEILDLIYKFRYYCVLPINNSKDIKHVDDLKEDIYLVIDILTKKAIENKIITKISENQEINNMIMKKIFETRIINLEDIYFKLIKENDKYYIQLFDENVSEDMFEIPKAKDLKINKKIKIFT